MYVTRYSQAQQTQQVSWFSEEETEKRCGRWGTRKHTPERISIKISKCLSADADHCCCTVCQWKRICGSLLTKRTTTTKCPECLRWNWWFSSDGSISPVLPSHSHPYFSQLGNGICRYKRCRFNPWVWKIPWRRKCQPTPVFLPGEFHG